GTSHPTTRATVGKTQRFQRSRYSPRCLTELARCRRLGAAYGTYQTHGGATRREQERCDRYRRSESLALTSEPRYPYAIGTRITPLANPATGCGALSVGSNSFDRRGEG